jgi:thioredoxin 1
MASFAELLRTPKPVLVDFTASWCGPCQAQAPILKDLVAEMGDRVRILKIDVDKNPELAKEQRVQSVPTLILFHEGKAVWRQNGVQSLAALRKAIDTVAKADKAFGTLYGFK